MAAKDDALRNLERIIGEGVGEASMCWETLDGAGEFNSARAGKIVTDLVQGAVAYAKEFSHDRHFQAKARRYVFEYVKARLEKTDKHITFAPDEVYVVWWSKTLQNWKCLISTTLPDGMYYEVTHNGDKKETYIDAYKKFDNITISEGEDDA